MFPYAPFIGNNFLLMQDNNAARIVDQHLTGVNIALIMWPARSPDLNPIEHLWDSIGRNIQNLVSTPARPQLRAFGRMRTS
jgi:transposase